MKKNLQRAYRPGFNLSQRRERSIREYIEKSLCRRVAEDKLFTPAANLAPTSKKSGLPPGGAAKSAKSGSKGLPTLGKSSSSAKHGSPNLSSSKGGMAVGGNYPSTSKNKSTTSFGVIWLPTRRHNRQKKDKIYDSYKDDYKTKKYPHNYFMHEEKDGKKLEEGELSEKAKAGVPLVGTAATAGATADTSNADDSDDTANLVSRRRDSQKDDDKQGEGDGKDSDYLDDRDSDSPKKSKQKPRDKMDGVYVKRPTNKGSSERSDTSSEPNNKCDNCIIDCLYFSMQCCECVIM